MRRITTDYVAGVMERIGGFAVHKNPKNHKLYLYFKIVSDCDYTHKITTFLTRKFNIGFRSYNIKNKKVFYITRYKDIKRLIEFMKLYCYRKDFNKFQETEHGYIRVPEVASTEILPKSI